ncbi:hypothetical protein [Parasulfitobacter algicola]|uniref:Lipoprotein n=1 Tax=Parasulfitobacter algicola TaxID=2614809 RepID=A0ABX2ISD4_9RHOB|nr:hypothetical protein [Sulfitobacter algicola]NSX55814.1 hypothetical protein [Sulfitobacter algicola]
MRFFIFALLAIGIWVFINQNSQISTENTITPVDISGQTPMDTYTDIIFYGTYAPAISAGCTAQEVNAYRPLMKLTVQMMATLDLSLQKQLMEEALALQSKVSQQCLKTAEAVGAQLSSIDHNRVTCYNSVCCSAYRCTQ